MPVDSLPIVPAGVSVVRWTGAVYVQPAYPMPAPGHAWGRHPDYGYGWRHPHYGWHRGWR